MIPDIGPRSIEHVCWCRPGQDPYLERAGAGSTPARSRLRRPAAHAAGKLITVAGGGDTVAALNTAGVTARLTHARLPAARSFGMAEASPRASRSCGWK
jgi:hypothetical protein